MGLGVVAFLYAALAVVAFAGPELWFRIFHGTEYVDPQGLLRKSGATWAAFAVIQVMAIFRWKKKPYWLAMVAGILFSDVLTDWTYLWFAHDITSAGRILLLIGAPANLGYAFFFLKAYRKRATR